jgi:hypothetical protein
VNRASGSISREEGVTLTNIGIGVKLARSRFLD